MTAEWFALPVATDKRTSPNHTARSRGSKIEMIVVHWPAGSFNSTLDWIGRTHAPDGEPIYASYHAVIGENGEVAYPVPWHRSAYSVGKSKADDPRFTWTTGGNSASESVSACKGPPTPITPKQRELLLRMLCARMIAHGWGPEDVWRIRGHDDVAWPRGRKDDPHGRAWAKQKPGRSLWLDLEPIRAEVARRLRERTTSSSMVN